MAQLRVYLHPGARWALAGVAALAQKYPLVKTVVAAVVGMEEGAGAMAEVEAEAPTHPFCLTPVE